MPHMIRSQPVTDSASLSVIKSKLVYSSLIFVDYKLTLTCLVTQQQYRNSFCLLYISHKLFYISGEFCILEDKRVRWIG